MKIGLKRFVRDLRRKRYRFRQVVGGAFVAFLVVLARPVWWGFAPGVCLVAAGALVRLWAAGHVRKDQVLATDGPYAFVRHPQYLGNCLLAAGFCLAAGHPWAIAVWAALFYLFYAPAIRREDSRLRTRFGEPWQDWYQETPAVVPTRWPSRNPGLRLFEWSALQALRNGEPGWLALIVAGLLAISSLLP